jgi:hypothetical protein
MISLCITGLSDSAIAVVAGTLQGAGVAPAQAAQRDADLSFASWHARVYQAAEQGQQENQDGAAAEAELPTLGRLWDQLASDLFLGNIQTPVWGWADAKSLGLLDYWLAFDSSIHFVLVATSPEQMLAEQLTDLTLADASATKALSAIPVDGLMARWNQAHHAMLRFALRNPARCMLVLADDLSKQVLVDATKASWPKALKALRVPQKDATSAMPELAPSSSDRVLRHFAEQWCEAYPQAKTLHQEIASVAAAANTKNSEKQASNAVLQDVLATLALARKAPSLHTQANDAARLLEARLKDEAELKTRFEQAVLAKTQLQSQLNEQVKANSALVQEKTALAQESQKRAQEVQATKSALEAEVLAKTKTMTALSDEKSQRKSADEEQALLLTQLHQVQEDLESYYLKCKELDKEVKSLGNAQRDLEAQGKANAELKEKLEEKRKARAALAGENAKLAQEKTKLIEARDSLVQARAQIQEKLNEAITQLEKEVKIHANLEIKLQAKRQALAAMQEEKFALAQENETLAQEKISASAAYEALTKVKTEALNDLAKAHVRAKMAEEESAQMLAQLHSLQEGAERYDLRIKDLQANLNQATARFRRVTSRQPDGIDWESVQTQPVMVDGRPALQCRATNVAVMGKEWKSLAFVAFIQDGTLAFTFLPNPDVASLGPLTRLPRGLGSLAQFTASAGREIPGQPGMELLKDLSTSDWDLLRGLPRLISVGLQYVRGAWPVDMPGPAAWENAAKATLPALLRVPAALRFDVLKLQSAATLANYEHLRLWLDPLSLGNKRFAGFEFRFGCNVGQGSPFGANARLEFFRGSGTSTFDQWVPNARDGDHERLDLVFVFPTSMNLKDWSALSENDRCLVLLLADQLPTVLAELGSSSVQTTRPMSDWVALAQKLRSFVRARLDVTGVQKQPDAFVDAVPGSVPQTGLNAPAKRRAALPSSVVSDITKPRAATKAPLAAKKPAPRIQSTGSAVRAEPARARKK